MALVDLCELTAVLRAQRRLLGIDLGTKTLGLAISDGLALSATPLVTLRRDRFTADAEALLDLCQKREVGGIVLGLPVNMDGSEGPRAQSTRSFAVNLSGKTDLPISFWDERLSTVAVTRFMLDADVSRAKRAAVVDKMAAAYILQGALDRLRTIGD